MHDFATASFFPGRFFYFSAFFNSLKAPGPAFRRTRSFQLVEKASLLRQAAYEQGLRPRSPRTAAFGGRFALHASALALRGVAGLP